MQEIVYGRRGRDAGAERRSRSVSVAETTISSVPIASRGSKKKSDKDDKAIPTVTTTVNGVSVTFTKDDLLTLPPTTKVTPQELERIWDNPREAWVTIKDIPLQLRLWPLVYGSGIASKTWDTCKQHYHTFKV
jgi:hypothetical protein